MVDECQGRGPVSHQYRPPIPVELVRTIGSNGILGHTTEYLLQGGSAMSIWTIQFVALLASAFILVVMML